MNDGMIFLNSKYYLLSSELSFTYVRSSGPGGQNVNKTNTQAVLRWNIEKNVTLSATAKLQIQIKLSSKLTESGDLLIRSDRFRDQRQNQKDCLEKLCKLLSLALKTQPKRIATKPNRSSIEKRLQKKRKDSEKKSNRRKKFSLVD